MVRRSQANNSFDTLLRKLGKMTMMVITMIAIVIMKITMTLIMGMLMVERKRNLRSIEMEVTKKMMVMTRMTMMMRRRRRKRPEQHRDGGDEHDEVAGCQHIRWH